MRLVLVIQTIGTLLVWLAPATALAVGCPAGFVEVSSAGTSYGCIELDEHSSNTWDGAEDSCYGLGGRLPTAQEWVIATSHFALNDEDDDFEWAADATGPDEFSVVKGGPFANGGAPDVRPSQTVVAYRCWIPAQGHSLAQVPLGPWWLALTLLVTGVYFQRRYFRRVNELA